ncbi:MAG: plasmid mobilization relaxosome protein MobC [Paracoccaceae bacterium]|nr:plasmid mobilization relaxosome protein MobC [Paracoccaceae bacterium]
MSDKRSDYQRDYQKDYQVRTKRVNLVFSASEYRSVKKSAGASGEALATYVKRRALEAHHGQLEAAVPEELLEQLADLDRVIRTIANNVNQMAHHSNQVRHVLDETQPFLYIQSLETELKKAIAAAKQYAAKTPPSGMT